MLNTPPVRDEAIVACLRASYGVAVAGLAFLPLGADANSWAYRVAAGDGRTFFLKLKRGLPPAASVAVPRALRDAGIAPIVAPLPTTSGALWGETGDFVALLYPFVAGTSGWTTPLTPAQWRAYGATMRAIHGAALPPVVARGVPREDFLPSARWTPTVARLLAGEHEAARDDETARDLAAFLRARRAEIAGLLRRTRELGRALGGGTTATVLCHGDLHRGNLLVAPQGGLHVVDWDQPIFAPRERDRMFVLGPTFNGFAVGSPEEVAFHTGYGEPALDPVALAFYRYDWALQDIGGYAWVVYWMPDAGAETRRESVEGVRTAFASGGIVAAAYGSEAHLTRAR